MTQRSYYCLPSERVVLEVIDLASRPSPRDGLPDPPAHTALQYHEGLYVPRLPPDNLNLNDATGLSTPGERTVREGQVNVSCRTLCAAPARPCLRPLTLGCRTLGCLRSPTARTPRPAQI